jgi:hypothetical protein
MLLRRWLPGLLLIACGIFFKPFLQELLCLFFGAI